MARHIKFVALCHESKVIASHTHWDRENREDYEAQLGNVFKTGQWVELVEGSKRKFELTSNENVYCIELDAQKRVYVAVITRLYPKRHIFSSSSGSKDPRLMTEFRSYVEAQLRHESAAAPERGLRKVLRPFLKQLASRFDDIEGIDRVAAAQAKVGQVQASVAAALSATSEREALLGGLDHKTKALSTSAHEMFTNAKTMRRAACCRSWKISALTVGCILLILAVAGALVYFFAIKK